MEWISEVVHLLFAWIQSLGGFGIMLGLMVEVIPSEIVLAFGGYLVSQGELSFAVAVIYGSIGGTIAQIFVYWVGRYGGRPFLERYGKYMLISMKHLELAEAWFKRYGSGVVFFARFIPIVRHAISIPAGISRMPLGKFALLSVLAIVPWSMFFVYAGMQLGDRWAQFDEQAAPYIQPAILVALGLAIIFFIVKYTRSRGKTL